MNSVNTKNFHKTRSHSSDVRTCATNTGLDTNCSEKKIIPVCENFNYSNKCENLSCTYHQCRKDSGFITPNSSNFDSVKEIGSQTSASASESNQSSQTNANNFFFNPSSVNVENFQNSFNLAGFIPANFAFFPPHITQSYPLFYIPIFFNSFIHHKPITHSKGIQTLSLKEENVNSKIQKNIEDLEVQVIQKLNLESIHESDTKMLAENLAHCDAALENDKRFEQNDVINREFSNNENISQSIDNFTHHQCNCGNECNRNQSHFINYQKLEDNEMEYKLSVNNSSPGFYKNEPSLNQMSCENLLQFTEESKGIVCNNETFVNSDHSGGDYDSNCSSDWNIDNRSYVVQDEENLQNIVQNNYHSHSSPVNPSNNYNNEQATMLMLSLLTNHKSVEKSNNSNLVTTLFNQIKNNQTQVKSNMEVSEEHPPSSNTSKASTIKSFRGCKEKMNSENPVNPVHKIPVVPEHSDSRRNQGNKTQYSKMFFTQEKY